MKIGSQTVAVITGAASGIGRALASDLGDRGAKLALLDIDRAGLSRVAAKVSKRCSIHVCDVADSRAVHVAAKAAVATHHGVHLLINNAGVSVAGLIEDLTIADFERAMAVNFWGVVHGSQAFLPHLRAAALRGEGAAVCNVLSDFALFSLPTKAAYAASKHAARAFTEALGAELQETGISVTAAYPGATATALVRRGHAVDELKQTREAEFLAQRMRPEAVASKIVRAVERGQAQVLIGYDTWLIAAATGFAPGLVQAAVRRFWQRVPFL